MAPTSIAASRKAMPNASAPTRVFGSSTSRSIACSTAVIAAAAGQRPCPPLTPRKAAPALAPSIAATRERRLSDIHGMDAYSPQEVARRVNDFCVVKARLPLLPLAMLGMLAGAFIGLGALVFTMVASDASLGFAATRFGGGLAFSLGLILVTVAGAELFTGNNLLAMGWATGCVDTRGVLRNWLVVCLANLCGAAGLALLVWLSGHPAMNGGAVGRSVVAIAQAKAQLSAPDAFFR